MSDSVVFVSQNEKSSFLDIIIFSFSWDNKSLSSEIQTFPQVHAWIRTFSNQMKKMFIQDVCVTFVHRFSMVNSYFPMVWSILFFSRCSLTFSVSFSCIANVICHSSFSVRPSFIWAKIIPSDYKVICKYF